MLDFLIYMVSMMIALSEITGAVFILYVGFDLRKRFTGDNYEQGFNITKTKFKREIKFLDDYLKNR